MSDVFLRMESGSQDSSSCCARSVFLEFYYQGTLPWWCLDLSLKLDRHVKIEEIPSSSSFGFASDLRFNLSLLLSLLFVCFFVRNTSHFPHLEENYPMIGSG